MQRYVTRKAWFAMNDPTLLSLDDLRALIERALVRGGMSAENAGPVAETMLVCERDGVKSHGLLRLPGFVRSVQVGWANGRAQPRIVTMQASMCVIDADNGFAQVCLTLTRDRLMDMARATGTARRSRTRTGGASMTLTGSMIPGP